VITTFLSPILLSYSIKYTYSSFSVIPRSSGIFSIITLLAFASFSSYFFFSSSVIMGVIGFNSTFGGGLLTHWNPSQKGFNSFSSPRALR
jgi:hypothetical protein